MGRIILYFQMTLDGVITDTEKWASIDQELLQDSYDRFDELDAIIFGSDSYPGMTEYWTQAEHSAETELERRFAAKLNRKKKYVASRSEVELVWNNSEHLKYTDIDSLSRELDKLRNQYQKDITVESGMKLWQVFIENSLFDGICAQIHPVIAGEGEKLFDGGGPKIPLFVERVKQFGSGVVKTVYSKK